MNGGAVFFLSAEMWLHHSLLLLLRARDFSPYPLPVQHRGAQHTLNSYLYSSQRSDLCVLFVISSCKMTSHSYSSWEDKDNLSQLRGLFNHLTVFLFRWEWEEIFIGAALKRGWNECFLSVSLRNHLEYTWDSFSVIVSPNHEAVVPGVWSACRAYV